MHFVKWNIYTLRFFFKFVSRVDNSLIYHQTERPGKFKKWSPSKVFGINHPQTLLLLSNRGPRCPEARLSQHYIGPKMKVCAENCADFNEEIVEKKIIHTCQQISECAQTQGRIFKVFYCKFTAKHFRIIHLYIFTSYYIYLGTCTSI